MTKFIGRIKIIFAAFINYSQISVFLRFLIRQNQINFMKFKRSGIIRVIYTDDEF